MAGPIVAALVYFALLAMAQSGVQTFSVVALAHIYAAPLDVAGGALTGYLLGIAAGILVGGFLADLIPRHGAVASVGLAPLGALHPAGGERRALPRPPAAGHGLRGVQHGGDVALARHAGAGDRARQRVGQGVRLRLFGARLGSLLAPMVFGWMLDHDHPRAVFAGVAVLLLVTILTVVQVRRGAVPATARA